MAFACKFIFIVVNLKSNLKNHFFKKEKKKKKKKNNLKTIFVFSLYLISDIVLIKEGIKLNNPFTT